MDGALKREARELLGAARALVSELAEEGMDRIDPSRGARPRPTVGAQPELLTALPAVAASERPSLESVRALLGDCTRCRLCEGRKQIVFGDGNPKAELMFIGEGPGEQEDLRGVPFVGRAGELLTSMIEKGLGLARNEIIERRAAMGLVGRARGEWVEAALAFAGGERETGQQHGGKRTK